MPFQPNSPLDCVLRATRSEAQFFDNDNGNDDKNDNKNDDIDNDDDETLKNLEKTEMRKTKKKLSKFTLGVFFPEA